MVFEEIIWLHYVVEKLAWKHRVVPSEVQEVLASRSTRHFRNQKGKIDGEDVYNALGRTEEGRNLSIFYIKKHDHRALIISARDMNKMEKNVMAKNNKRAKPPPDMTIAEASEFWDEHSLFEFEGTEEVEVEFKLNRKQYVGIDLEIFKKVKAQARHRKMSPEALLEAWISEKITTQR